jgi:hypothetical protein
MKEGGLVEAIMNKPGFNIFRDHIVNGLWNTLSKPGGA